MFQSWNIQHKNTQKFIYLCIFGSLRDINENGHKSITKQKRVHYFWSDLRVIFQQTRCSKKLDMGLKVKSFTLIISFSSYSYSLLFFFLSFIIYFKCFFALKQYIIFCWGNWQWRALGIKLGVNESAKSLKKGLEKVLWEIFKPKAIHLCIQFCLDYSPRNPISWLLSHPIPTPSFFILNLPKCLTILFLISMFVICISFTSS